MSWFKILTAISTPVFLFAAACTRHDLPEPAAPLTEPTRLCAEGESAACRSAAAVRSMMLREDLRLLGMGDTPGGMQGAKILTLQGKTGGRAVTFRARWRAQSSGGLINEPRKELAAYAVQQLFLDEAEAVIPPTAAYCFPLEDYRHFAPDESASFAGGKCVLGYLTYWLEGVKTVRSAREDGWMKHGDGMWDPELFAHDAVYRETVANCNVLMHLINHGDAHDEQLLLERTPRGLRSYVVDNSIAFLSIKNPLLLVREDWSAIQVPRVPAKTLERLAAIGTTEMSRLANIQELELREGRLVTVPQNTVEPTNDQPASSAVEMSWHGDRLRIGLTHNEIDLVWSRIRSLLSRPDLPQLSEPATRDASPAAPQ